MAADADIPVLDDYPNLGRELGSGTYGFVYEVVGDRDQIAKVFDAYSLGDADIRNLIQEVTIQQKLYEKVPGSCPKIHTFGKATTYQGNDDYIIIMEKCEGTARSWLKNNGNDDAVVLSYLEQVAAILKKAKPFDFNHRDLKSDNIMYKTIERANLKTKKVEKIKKYLLIDFGFSCATFDGVKYEGTTYFKPGIKCFRESRDLALLVYELLQFRRLSADMIKFVQLLLRFDYKGKTCDMTTGCLPDFDGDWVAAYGFLDKDDVENPNTTPDGLLKAIEAYRTKGIQACEKDGFILDPVKDKCVSAPGAPIAAALKPAVSPGKGHLASPVVNDLYVSPVTSAKTWPGGKKHRTRRVRPKKRTRKVKKSTR